MEEQHCFSILIRVSQVGLSVEGREFSSRCQARDRAKLTDIVTFNKAGERGVGSRIWIVEAKMAVTITFNDHFLQIFSTAQTPSKPS